MFVKIIAKNREKLKILLYVALSYLCVLSFARIYTMDGYERFGYNGYAVVLFAADIYLLKRYFDDTDRRLKVIASIGGVLMGFCIVYGAYAHYTNDIFTSAAESFLQIGMVLAISALTTPLAAELLKLFDRLNVWGGKHTAVVLAGTTYKSFLCFWGVIFLAYVPLFLTWWPGNFIWDAPYQMRNVIRNYYTTHHPLAHTLLMGGAYKLGQSVGNVAWGYQFYTLFQMLVLSSAFAYAVYYAKKKGLPKLIWLGMLAWFALFPMHALFAITATKDVLCAAFFLYFIIFLIRLLVDGEAFSRYSYAGMIASGVLLALFRNNVMHALLATAVVIIFWIKGRKSKLKLVGIFAAIFILTQGANHALVAATNAIGADVYRETFSVLLQCIARVGSYRTEEIPDDLYEEMQLYIDAKTMNRYNPYLSDEVKNNTNEYLLENNTLNFFKLWLKLGLKFPDEYFEAFITNSMGYWYPLNRGGYVSMDIALYHTMIEAGDEIEKQCYCEWAYEPYFNLFCKTTYHQVPVLGFLFRSVVYIWGLVAFVLWCIYRKKYKEMMPGILMLMYFATCLLGPVVAMRYVYCIMVAAPMLPCVICLSKTMKRDNIKD